MRGNRPLLEVGTFRQKANWFLVGFVFGCATIITLLLYVMVRAEAKADDFTSLSVYKQYNVE